MSTGKGGESAQSLFWLFRQCGGGHCQAPSHTSAQPLRSGDSLLPGCLPSLAAGTELPRALRRKLSCCSAFSRISFLLERNLELVHLILPQ